MYLKYSAKLKNNEFHNPFLSNVYGLAFEKYVPQIQFTFIAIARVVLR